MFRLVVEEARSDAEMKSLEPEARSEKRHLTTVVSSSSCICVSTVDTAWGSLASQPYISAFHKRLRLELASRLMAFSGGGKACNTC